MKRFLSSFHGAKALDFLRKSVKIISLFVSRLFSRWQGLSAGLISIFIYLVSPYLIRTVDPTAGAFDGGMLQWILLAAALYFSSVFCVCAAWQSAYYALDKIYDVKINEWFESFCPKHRWLLAEGTFLIMIVWFFICLKITPLK